MAEYQAILLGAAIGLVGSIVAAAIVVGRVKPTIVFGFVGLLLGATVGGALASQRLTKETCRTINATFSLNSFFFPTGWMGDAVMGEKHLKFELNHRDCHRDGDSDGSCMRIQYTPGHNGWCGIYWQYPENNWGNTPGTSIENIQRISFWAKGELGDELVEFKAGGIRAPGKQYSDSFEATSGQISLSDEWRRYEINLTGHDLSSVLGAFAVIFPQQNHKGENISVLIDEINYE